MKAKRKRIIVSINTKLNTLERVNKESLRFKLRTVKVVVCLSPAVCKYTYRKGRALNLTRLGVLPEEYEGGRDGLGIKVYVS